MEFNRKDVLSTLRKSGSKGLKTREIAHNLGAGSKDLRSLRLLINDLESEGIIVRGRRRRYQLPEEVGYIKGTLMGYGKSVALVIPVDGSQPLEVSGDSLRGAHHGDTVMTRTVRGDAGQREAQIMRILSRAPSEFVGQVLGQRKGRYVHVDTRYRRSVAVERASTVKPGDYVLVRVPRWGEPYEQARGRITEVLGGRFTPGEAFASIVKEFNLPLGFPQAVVNEIKSIPHAISEAELRRREDLTGLLTFTIDPADARDFDDAISVEDLGKGRLRVGVHIADVSHYVRQGSYLDHEAMARGRSIYMVDRVIPMLPAKLSSEMAALRPGEPRLAVSVIMDIGKRGEVASYTLKESLIGSRARLTYDEAQRLIDKGAGWRASKEKKQIADALKRADELRRKLRDRRIGRGAIELETPELDIVLDASGNAVDVKPTKRLDSHNLIEELMILANETIAQHMAYLGRLFVYRVHEVPAEDDMGDLAVFAATMGYRFRWTKGTSPRALQSLLEKVRGRPEEYVISMFILRSLKKAQYSQRNVGHFGLASDCYTHFTSPIRRYSDLVVHRLLKIYGFDKSSPKDKGGLLRFIRQASETASVREIESDEAERASIKARVAEFMEHRIGGEYWGIVSGIRDFGFFVMLEDKLIEGLVHVSTLGDDYYTRDSTGTLLMGARTGRSYRIGDRVRIKVSHVDRGRREVDFVVIGRESPEGKQTAAVAVEARSGRRRLHREVRTETRRARSAGRRRGRPKARTSEAQRTKTSGKPDRPRRRRIPPKKR